MDYRHLLTAGLGFAVAALLFGSGGTTSETPERSELHLITRERDIARRREAELRDQVRRLLTASTPAPMVSAPSPRAPESEAPIEENDEVDPSIVDWLFEDDRLSLVLDTLDFIEQNELIDAIPELLDLWMTTRNPLVKSRAGEVLESLARAADLAFEEQAAMLSRWRIPPLPFEKP